MRKLAVISSGTKGIGRATAEKFFFNGFDIVTCARSADDLLQLKEELEEKGEGEVFFRPTDMARKEEVLAFAAYVKGLNRPVEVLLNNTGLFLPGSIHTEPEGNLEKMIETNLYSAYHLTRALVDDMKARKQGHIFTTGSIAGITAYPNGGSYSISKYALLGFTKCLREELKEHGIRVTSILPGATYTASWEGVDLPRERFMKAEDIAEAIYAAHSLSPQTVVEEIVLRPQLGDI
ncbi:SDR family oxidoreductase [Roseivirga thermotolerans]|uniref:Short-chain dehydrogenase n=1 Tax=Roseivirga thermotolerans TaxID=1758176 RepID=A0ABQ3I6V8_9BACT|nr:SDR family oxidoreductase [Roseivirga thermotolerans]GHE67935.1 short-chain dehydrogenase [Roseivirga thermotolerans]